MAYKKSKELLSGGYKPQGSSLFTPTAFPKAPKNQPTTGPKKSMEFPLKPGVQLNAGPMQGPIQLASKLPAQNGTSNPVKSKIDPNSIDDFLMSQNKGNTFADKAKIAKSMGISDYTGSSAQNQALLAKLKGYAGTTDQKKISGSSSVNQNKQMTGATNAAAGSINPPSDNSQNEQPVQGQDQVQGATQDEGTGNKTLDMYNDNAEASIKQLESQYGHQLSQIEIPFQQNYSGMQEQMKQAMAAAQQEYERAGGVVSSTGEQEYIGNVQKHYQAQLNNLQMQYQADKQNLLDTLSAGKLSIEQQHQEQVAAYQSNQLSNFKDYVGALKIGDGSMPDSAELLDAIELAMAGGKSFTQAKAEIDGALSYAARVQRKADLQDRAILSSLGSKSSDKVLTPAEIKNLKDQYPDIKGLDYGLTSSGAIDVISNNVISKPTFKLASQATHPGGFNVLKSAGLNQEMIDEIKDSLANGYDKDDIIDAIPDEYMTPSLKSELNKLIKPIKKK